MLSSISWQQYLAAVVIITVSYYLYVILRYYQTEIANLFHRKHEPSNVFSGVQSSPFQVMGEAKLDNGVTLCDSQELQFTEVSPGEADVHSSNTEPKVSHNEITSDPAIEFIDEAGNLIEAFKDIDNKTEFLTLLKILIDSYKRFRDDIDLPAALNRIVELSKEKLQFPIALTDLQST
jgi:hypothetical protein